MVPDCLIAIGTGSIHGIPLAFIQSLCQKHRYHNLKNGHYYFAVIIAVKRELK
jgi:hypothetical protein